MNLNQCIHIFFKKKIYHILDLHFTVKIHKSLYSEIPKKLQGTYK